MPHDYALHTELEARCLCCGSLQPFTFTSDSDQVVCAHCRSHLGPEKAERRDLAHIALWRGISEAQALAASAAAAQAEADAEESATRIAELEAKVAELSATVIGQFDSAPASGVREELQSDLVRRAERATELANRRTDRMMAVLWRLGVLHHAAGGGRRLQLWEADHRLPRAAHPELRAAGAARVGGEERGARRSGIAARAAAGASGGDGCRRLSGRGSGRCVGALHPADASGTPRSLRSALTQQQAGRYGDPVPAAARSASS